MKTPIETYIKGLREIGSDLSTVLEDWPLGPSFDQAKSHAESMLPLIYGEIERLEDTKKIIDHSDPFKLRNEINSLVDVIPDEDGKSKFRSHSAMLDTYIDEYY